jgi:GT2 family glycosyltransferase
VCPTISIAIVNWNTRDLLLDALNSIYNDDAAPELEVFVVDNNSSDGSADSVADRYPQAILTRNAINIGYAAGNNQAIKQAKAPYILLLNPDVVVPNGTFAQVAAFMEAHPDAGAIGIRQVHPDGRIQSSVRGFPTPLAMMWELIGFAKLFPQSRLFGAYRMTWFAYDSVAEVDQPMGTFLLIRRSALDAVGLLDEQFPIFFNEVDWCLRCKRAGWKIYFDPDAEIVHYGGSSTVQVGAAMAWESRRGLLTFYNKHYRMPWLWPLRAAIAAASWPHAWMQARRRGKREKGRGKREE